jgi:hypothetical protein
MAADHRAAGVNRLLLLHSEKDHNAFVPYQNMPVQTRDNRPRYVKDPVAIACMHAIELMYYSVLRLLLTAVNKDC